MEKGKQVVAPADNAKKGKQVAAGAEHAEKGKQVAAGAEQAEKAKQVVDAEGGKGSSGFGGRVYTGVNPMKRKYETEEQIRRKKKKNLKNKLRQERKERGEKIYSPADVMTFRESDSDDSDKESDGVRSDEEDRDRKSRAMLKKFKAGDIQYLLGPGEYKCPWCFRKEMPKDYLAMLQHATYYGARSQKHQPHLKAKHAAYGVFLLKHVP